MTTFRLTLVVDNKAADGLAAEHGYSLHIETPEGNLLLDTGQKGALLNNAEALGIDFSALSALVLSHGHYDHTGGIRDILEENRKLDIYLHAAVFQPRYSLDGRNARIIKMPLNAMEAVMHYDDRRVHWLTKPVSPLNGVGITGPIARKCEFEDTGGNFYLDPEGKEIDTIKDDVAVWLHGEAGLVVCLGCCHAGLVNTLDHIMTRTGEKRVDTIIGGMHLLHAGKERLDRTAAALNSMDIGRIIACHCSGDEAVSYLAERLDCEVSTGYAGLRLAI